VIIILIITFGVAYSGTLDSNSVSSFISSINTQFINLMKFNPLYDLTIEFTQYFDTTIPSDSFINVFIALLCYEVLVEILVLVTDILLFLPRNLRDWAERRF